MQTLCSGRETSLRQWKGWQTANLYYECFALAGELLFCLRILLMFPVTSLHSDIQNGNGFLSVSRSKTSNSSFHKSSILLHF